MQQAIDQSVSGGLNYHGVQTIRECIGMTFPGPSAMEGQHIACSVIWSRKRRKFLFLSDFLLREEARKLEDHGKSLGIGFEEDNGHHPLLKCNCDAMLKFILKTHKLDEIVEREDGVETA